MTKIDIILPYYNGSRFIEQQLQSILDSDLENIELDIIIINDASTREETEFIKRILPSKVKYIENQTNLGVTKSIEKGLQNSNSPYVMFCDQDDVWLPNKIKHSLQKIKEIEKEQPALVYTDLVITGPNLEHLHPSMHRFYNHNHDAIKPSVLFHNIVTGCTIILNRKLVDIGLPFPKQITMHDHWYAVCATFAGQIALLDESTILYRQHGNNQVGTPNRSVLWKIFHFKATVPKFRRHLKMKSAMATSLAERLEKIGKNQESTFLKSIVRAIQKKNFLYLIETGAISGSIVRKIATSGLLLIQPSNTDQ